MVPSISCSRRTVSRRLDGRREDEALTDWLTRIEPLAKLPLTPLPCLLALHYRVRFDPQGLQQDEREALRSGVISGVISWLAQAKPV